jgi:hAT family C-terminal dimerisation region
MSGIEEPHELDEYLSQPIEKVRDPMKWWWDHRHVYPKLSSMALDYLSVPGKKH